MGQFFNTGSQGDRECVRLVIRVMSFNIRYGLAPDGSNRWNRRKALVIERIRAFRPDLIGLQECRDDAQAAFVQSELPEYEFIGVRRGGGGDTDAEMAPLLYLKSSFREVRRGHFWLSETPEIAGSKSWGSVFARTATWVELLPGGGGGSILFLNTHFDYATDLAIERSARLLQRWAAATVGKLAVVITGDFNTGKDTPAYACLASGEPLSDVYRKAHAGKGDEGTYHGFGQPGEPAPIDWILASAHFQVVTAEIDRTRQGSLYPSDHFPLNAVLNLGNLNG
jgi:endonuclease/exonuclease/phosphatase family metal-dependent hydrolase